jgi:predicted signal transduction protein with EAL and GGDEF domain
VPPGALDRRGGYLLLAVVGALLCCGMNYATGDPSAGAQAFLAFPVPDGDLLAVSVSLGVAHAPSHARGLEELYAAADAALYAAKRAGRGRVEVAGVS